MQGTTYSHDYLKGFAQANTGQLILCLCSMEQLPLDILLDILSRLPVQSLLRFKCVSKPWCKMIDQPFFAHMHLAREVEEPRILILAPSDHELAPNLMTYKDASEVLVMKLAILEGMVSQGSCNGLLCFTNYHNDGILILLNPLRQQVLEVPPPAEIPSSSPRTRYGLGYDKKTNAHKIVCITSRKKKSHDLEAQAFTLGSKSWRVLNRGPPCPLQGKPIFASGALHWTVDPRVELDELQTKVVSFDMNKEEFFFLPHPKFHSCHLVGLKGLLAMVDRSSNEHIDVWLLQNYERKEWAKLYRINMKAPVMVEDNRHIEVIGIWNKSEILIRGLHDSFLSYCPCSDRLRFIHHIPGVDEDATEIHTLVNSLVSVSAFAWQT